MPPVLSQSVGTLTASSTSLVSSANPSTPNQQVTFTATVAGTDNGGTVSFTDDGFAIAGCGSLALTAGQATCGQTFGDVGSHPMVATYSGDANFAGSSSAVVSQSVALAAAGAVPGVAATTPGGGVAQVAFNPGAPAPTVAERV